MKAATLSAGGNQTVQTRVFDIVRGAPWPAIYPGRALRNAFSTRWHGHAEALETDQPAQESAYLATAQDDFTTRAVWAGEGVDLVRVPSAAEIIERTMTQAVATIIHGVATGAGNLGALSRHQSRRDDIACAADQLGSLCNKNPGQGPTKHFGAQDHPKRRHGPIGRPSRDRTAQAPCPSGLACSSSTS
jgi:hypothetical protein